MNARVVVVVEVVDRPVHDAQEQRLGRLVLPLHQEQEEVAGVVVAARQREVDPQTACLRQIDQQRVQHLGEGLRPEELDHPQDDAAGRGHVQRTGRAHALVICSDALVRVAAERARGEFVLLVPAAALRLLFLFCIWCLFV